MTKIGYINRSGDDGYSGGGSSVAKANTRDIVEDEFPRDCRIPSLAEIATTNFTAEEAIRVEHLNNHLSEPQYKPSAA